MVPTPMTVPATPPPPFPPTLFLWGAGELLFDGGSTTVSPMAVAYIPPTFLPPPPPLPLPIP